MNQIEQQCVVLSAIFLTAVVIFIIKTKKDGIKINKD